MYIYILMAMQIYNFGNDLWRRNMGEYVKNKKDMKFQSQDALKTVQSVIDDADKALHLSKAGAYNLLNADDFPTLKIGGRKLVMKQDLLLWLKKHTNDQEPKKTENSQ